MGNCIRRKGRIYSAPPTSASNFRSIPELKEAIVQNIIKTHCIVNNCRKGIEECLILNTKEIAILIKMKEIFLRKRIEELQIMVEFLDKIDDLHSEDKSQQKKILKEGNAMIKDINSGLGIDDIALILQNDQEYNQSVKTEVLKFIHNERDIRMQIETEFQKRKILQPNDRIRRKYSKEIKSNF